MACALTAILDIIYSCVEVMLDIKSLFESRGALVGEKLNCLREDRGLAKPDLSLRMGSCELP